MKVHTRIFKYELSTFFIAVTNPSVFLTGEYYTHWITLGNCSSYPKKILTKQLFFFNFDEATNLGYYSALLVMVYFNLLSNAFILTIKMRTCIYTLNKPI